MRDSGSDRGASADLDGSAASDANTDTDFRTGLDRFSLFGRNSKRLFHASTHKGLTPGSAWCSVALNDDCEDIACNYSDYTGKDFWTETSAILSAAEPAFKAQYEYHDDTGYYISMRTPKKSHVKRLKQLLMDLEPRYKGYSVPKLTQLVRVNLSEARYSMRAVIEFQDKFGKDSAMHMLESHTDIMVTRVYCLGYTWGSGTANEV